MIWIPFAARVAGVLKPDGSRFVVVEMIVVLFAGLAHDEICAMYKLELSVISFRPVPEIHDAPVGVDRVRSGPLVRTERRHTTLATALVFTAHDRSWRVRFALD